MRLNSKYHRTFSYPLMWVLMFMALNGQCQETIFNVFEDDVSLADTYYNNEDYYQALKMYLLSDDNSGEKSLKIARCYYFLRRFENSVKAYDKVPGKVAKLPVKDLYFYAEAQAGLGNYKEAIKTYKQYLAKDPENDLIHKKIWRLDNIRYLYEDSAHYDIRPLSINSDYGDMAAVPYRKGIVFISNRKKVVLIKKRDASSNAPFYKMYYSHIISDTLGMGNDKYIDPVPFNNDISSKYHTGPVSFYDDYRKMVFSVTGDISENSLLKTLQLHFAEDQGGTWKIVDKFSYNSNSYSINNPTITNDGKVLYFSSDMPGGKGGKDIYRSEFKDGKWSEPENLGDIINTVYDEVFPYLHLNKTLYFSSEGHAGMGGLDIFRSDLIPGGFGEVENIGYPLNSNADDFGIIIDSLSTYGYLSSNRKNGGLNDDIYTFDMDIQPYPLEISGVIKYVEHSWTDSSELKILPNVKLVLMDNYRDITVAESNSDSLGHFTINVPYYSAYRLQVSGMEIGEGVVSFVVPKHRKQKGNYEIVVVKDDFRSNENEDRR